MSDWLLIVFAAAVCLGSGLTVAAGLGEVKQFSVSSLVRCSAVALIVLLAAGVAVTFHVGRPAMIFGVLANPGTGIWREFVTFGLTVLLVAAYLIALLRGSEAGTTRMLALASALSAGLLTLAVGSAYIMAWRPGWNTWTLMLPFAGWTALAAAAAYRLLETREESGESMAQTVTGAALLLAVLCTGAYLCATGLSADAEPAAARLLTGDLMVPFWASAALGLLPAGITLLTRSRSAFLQVIALVCAFAGTAGFQWIVQVLGSPAWQFFGQ